MTKEHQQDDVEQRYEPAQPGRLAFYGNPGDEAKPTPRGFRFHLRTCLWALTHPFSNTWNNPGVVETLKRYEAEVARITALKIADDLREEFPPSDIPDYIDREFGGA